MAKHVFQPNSWLFNEINGIITTLKERTDYHFRLKTIEMIDKNHKLEGTLQTLHGFYFRGQLYHKFAAGIPTKGTRFGSLHLSLIPEMDDMLKLRRNEEFEFVRIKNGLAVLLARATTQQDIRDSIPNCLADIIPNLKNLPRIREEAFLLNKQSNHYRQYMVIKPIIEYYCALRLLG